MHADHLAIMWQARFERLGPCKRGVICKRFPSIANEMVHRRHVSFVLNTLGSLPPRAEILDVGCGYGRIAKELINLYPDLTVEGIDICKPFVDHFEKSVGPCFYGAIEEYRPRQSFDAIMAVTSLMYLEDSARRAALHRLWTALKPGGVFICVEPSVALPRLCRRFLGRTPKATGGSVRYFTRNEIELFFADEPDSSLTNVASLKVVPRLPCTTLHYLSAWRKEESDER